MPGEREDGTVVDLWSCSGKGTECPSVNWSVPGPAMSTGRRLGRWRSFPYLLRTAENEPFVNWRWFCEHHNSGVSPGDPGRLVRFKFWTLAAETLPDMGYGETRKRMVEEVECGEGVGNLEGGGGGNDR